MLNPSSSTTDFSSLVLWKWASVLWKGERCDNTAAAIIIAHIRLLRKGERVVVRRCSGGRKTEKVLRARNCRSHVSGDGKNEAPRRPEPRSFRIKTLRLVPSLRQDDWGRGVSVEKEVIIVFMPGEFSRAPG